MKTRLSKIVAIGSAFLMGMLFVGAAWATTTTLFNGNVKVTGTVSAGSFKYLKAQTGIYNVSGAAFTADAADESTNISHNDYSGSVVLSPNQTADAPVILPQGAVIKKVAVQSDALPTTDDLTLHVEASNFTGDHDDMTQIHNSTVCSTAPCLTTATSFTPSTIDNVHRTYGLYLDASGPDTLTVYRVAIYFSVTKPALSSAGSVASGSTSGTLVSSNH